MKTARCHPDRKHLARGLCGACYWRDYAAADRPRQSRPSTEGWCECGRPVYARRLCRPHYMKARAADRVTKRAQCHPTRALVSRGLCAACYRKWRATSTERPRALCAHPHRPDYGRGMCVQCCKVASTYDLTPDETRSAVSAPFCEVCGSPFTAKRRRAIDHDHTTGKFRGVLCNNCNAALGFVREDPAVLRACIAYLENRT